MKTLLWTLVWGAATVGSLAAQQDNVWIANRGSNSVTVTDAAGAELTTLSGPPFNFAAPYDIVHVPAFNMVVVSNNASNELTVIDSRTFAHIQSVGLVNGSNLRGMSVSADQQVVFVAAKHNSNEPGVYRLLMSDLSSAFVGGIVDASADAEDVVVISSSRVGGSGNGPGKIYYSVPNSSPNGYLGVIPFNPPGPVTSISTGSSPLANVILPTQMERAPDDSLFFVGCTTSDGIAQQRIIRVVPGVTDIVTQPVVRSTIQSLPHIVQDIAFRPVFPPFRAYLNGAVDSGSLEIIEIDGSGAMQPVAARSTGVPAADRIRFDPSSNRLFIGENSGTSNQYGISDASGQPVSAVSITLLPMFNSGPAAFAFAQGAPGPSISDVCPSGLISAAGTFVEILGSGFDPACTVDFYNSFGVPTARTVTFVNAGHLQVNGDGLAPGLYEVRVTNPDAQNYRLVDYFLSIQSPTTPAPFPPIVLPSRLEGYAMRAFPQYALSSDLLDAVRTQLGGYNPSSIRIFLQNGSGYIELDKIPPGQPCDIAGKPFWVLTRFGGVLSLGMPGVGDSLQDVSRDEKMQILQPGWNMFTNPTYTGTNARMDLNDIAVFSDGALTVNEGSLFTTAGGITSSPFEYVNGVYNPVTVGLLNCNEGYWIRNNSAGPLFLRYLSSDSQAKTRLAAPRVAGAAKALPVPKGDALPPAPPVSGVAEDGGTSGCGATGLEAFLLAGLLAALRRRPRGA